MDLEQKLTALDPSKKCLQFLAKRVLSDDYRGIHLSQHFRYDMDDILVVLKAIYKNKGMDLLHIRTTDISKRPYNTENEIDYARVVNEINKTRGKIKQDSLRKNIFPDMHRMGLIARYDKNKEYIEPYERKSVVYVSLTYIGKMLASDDLSYFKKYNIYKECINKLTSFLPEVLLDLINAHGKLTTDEFQLFVTFLGKKIDGVLYTLDEVSELIREYRSLSRIQREEIINILKRYCDPSKFVGNKIAKRDYGNWRNESQQIIGLLGQTIYYEFKRENDCLIPRIDSKLLFDDVKKLNRSVEEKNKYFKNHKISRQLGYELHHIFPLMYAENKEQYKILDDWRNMLYIDGKTHSIITHGSNLYVKLSFENDTIILKEYNGNDRIICKKDDQALYNPELKDIMLSYNRELLKGK